jgi:type II secretory pathway component PulJ
MKTVHHSRFSFTLVEMIVAMGILSVLTVLLFSVLSETTRAINMSSGRTKVYTELRVVIDQFSRDLQQTVDDDRFNCFQGVASNDIHFVSTIDNNTGNEEAEIGYIYYARSNWLLKTVQFSQKGNPLSLNGNWNVGDAQAGIGAWGNDWRTTPDTNATIGTEYVVVLEGVRHFSVSYLNTNFVSAGTSWDFTGQGKRLPSYVITTIGLCDPQDVIRYRGAANVPPELVRWFTNQVFLPRQQ